MSFIFAERRLDLAPAILLGDLPHLSQVVQLVNLAYGNEAVLSYSVSPICVGKFGVKQVYSSDDNSMMPTLRIEIFSIVGAYPGKQVVTIKLFEYYRQRFMAQLKQICPGLILRPHVVVDPIPVVTPVSPPSYMDSLPVREVSTGVH